VQGPGIFAEYARPARAVEDTQVIASTKGRGMIVAAAVYNTIQGLEYVMPVGACHAAGATTAAALLQTFLRNHLCS
jgi:hypothetical protein